MAYSTSRFRLSPLKNGRYYNFLLRIGVKTSKNKSLGTQRKSDALQIFNVRGHTV